MVYLANDSHIYYGTNELDMEMIEGEEIIGETGYNITTLETHPNTNDVLLNETPFKCGNDWYVEGNHWGDLPGSTYQVDDSGVLIQLGPTSDLYDMEKRISFLYRFYVSLFDISEISVHIDGRGLNNEVIMALEMSYYWGYHPVPLLMSESVEIMPDHSFVFSNTAQIPVLSPEFDELLTPISLEFEVRGPIHSEILIESIVVTAVSSQNLCKLTVDYLDTLGNSVLVNQPYYSYLHQQINFTGRGLFSEVYCHRYNTTIFIREGTYYLEEIGLFGYHDSHQNLTIHLQNNQTSWIGFSYPFARLYLDIQPLIPSFIMSIEGVREYILAPISPFIQPYPEFIYLPPGKSSCSVNLYPHGLWDIHQRTYHVSAYSNTTSDWILKITTNMRVWGNVAIPDFLILPMILVPLLGVFEILHLYKIKRERRIHEILKSPELYPILLLVSSVVLPWAVLKTSNDWSFVYYLPLFTDIVSVNSSVGVFSLTKIGRFLSFGISGGYIFWVIIIFLVLLSHYHFNGRGGFFGFTLAFSFILSLWIVMQCMLLSVSFGIGTILSLAAFPVWLCLKAIMHFKNKSISSPMRQVKHGNPGIGATKSSAYVPLK